MEQNMKGFLSCLKVEKGYSNNTIVAYRNDLAQFLRWLGESVEPALKSWEDITKRILLSYVLYLKTDREYATATVARKIAAIKSFFHYLTGEGVIEENPTATLDSPKVRKYLPKAISQEDVDTLLSAPARHPGPRSLRDSAILEILYASGMRVSELVALNVGDVNLASANVRCVGKANKERIIPIYPQAARAIEKYVTEGRIQLLRDSTEKALFLNHRGGRLTRQGLWLIIKRYVEETGIAVPVTPHTLRHSFATHMLSGGADLQDVQALLGHASISTTQIYKQVTPEQLREIYDDAHPKA
ncbi:MAG: site-specific tyrosine recombinase XerD [Chloroflexota bacterium]|nr:site-specific tyrosine recombinase XerD [Anaerolineae bacterium]